MKRAIHPHIFIQFGLWFAIAFVGSGCKPISRPVVTEAAYQDTVRKLTVALGMDGYLYIERNGSTQQFETPVTDESWGRWQEFPYALLVADLDGTQDGEPEILLLVSTSGASCCTTLTVLYFDGETERYAKTESLYRKFTLGFDPIDLDGDGLLEIRTLNEDFNYALGGASVISFLSPLQIFQVRRGNLLEVTANFPTLLEERVTRWEEDTETLCTIFAAGAYLAEMTMLNLQGEGKLRLRQQCLFDKDEEQLLNDVLHKFNYTNN